METKIARIASKVFHPIFMPFLAFTLILTGENYLANIFPLQTRLIILAIVFINTVMGPALISYFLLKKQLIKSFEMDTPGERKIPYLVTAVFYILTCYMLRQLGLSPLFYIVLLCAALSLIITILINLLWKISAHMVGLGGVLGGIIALSVKMEADYASLIILLFVIAGVIGYSRLRLNAHVPAQIYAGFFVGFLPQLLFIL